jgi:4-methylaminobutanoate oxidase (formaldehyde-forming)
VSALPGHAEIVIVGGGIAGVSVAYHLAKLGKRDVLLIEQGSLTCGTTWHAAGLVGQMRPNRSMTRMSQYGIGLYATLEAETGLATGWKQCGSVNVARTPERWIVFQRQAAMARSFGIEVHLIGTARSGGEMAGHANRRSAGGALVPARRKGESGGSHAVASRRVRAISRVRSCRAYRRPASARERAGAGSQHRLGRRALRGAGELRRPVGALSSVRSQGVSVPLHSAEHFYIVTERIAGVHPMLPVMRDPDGFIYFKEEVGGLLMGGFEPQAKPWGMAGIPEKFEFQLLPEDWEQFEILMKNAIHRVPALETSGVKTMVNGPESFTPDGNFILGEAPEVRNYFVAAGFNSGRNRERRRRRKAARRMDRRGEAPMDLFEVDIRRFGPYAAAADWLRVRTVETLGLHYAMRWPRQELESGRPLLKSPLYERLEGKGRVLRLEDGLGAAQLVRRCPGETASRCATRSSGPDWLDAGDRRAACAVRNAAGVFDQTSFGKLSVRGRDALAVLERLCANRHRRAGRTRRLHAMLNARGGFESDLDRATARRRLSSSSSRERAAECAMRRGSGAMCAQTSKYTLRTSRPRGRSSR